MSYTLRDAISDTLTGAMSDTATTSHDSLGDIPDELVAREELEQDENWVRSIGMNVICTHYRERDGTRHAVCPPGGDTCYIHEDRENAHTNPVSHLVKDAPELLVLAGVGIFLGPAAMKKTWRILP